MGVYIKAHQHQRMTWLAMHATPLELTLAGKLSAHPWNPKSDLVALAYSEKDDAIAVMFSKDEYRRFTDAHVDVRYFTAPRDVVAKASSTPSLLKHKCKGDCGGEPGRFDCNAGCGGTGMKHVPAE